jgi:pentapeptide repeat protein
MTPTELLTAYEAGQRDFHGADLSRAYLTGAYLTGVNLIGADLRRANLIGADLRRADMRGANLIGADLRRANLIGADLRRANMRGAYLIGAYLTGADLTGADLGEQWIIQGPVRSDGHQFMLTRLTGEATPIVRAGCRWLSLPNARKHWEETRGGTQLGHESLDILIFLERAMNVRGLK